MYPTCKPGAAEGPAAAAPPILPYYTPVVHPCALPGVFPPAAGGHCNLGADAVIWRQDLFRAAPVPPVAGGAPLHPAKKRRNPHEKTAPACGEPNRDDALFLQRLRRTFSAAGPGTPRTPRRPRPGTPEPQLSGPRPPARLRRPAQLRRPLSRRRRLPAAGGAPQRGHLPDFVAGDLRHLHAVLDVQGQRRAEPAGRQPQRHQRRHGAGV